MIPQITCAGNKGLVPMKLPPMAGHVFIKSTHDVKRNSRQTRAQKSDAMFDVGKAFLLIADFAFDAERAAVSHTNQGADELGGVRLTPA